MTYVVRFCRWEGHKCSLETFFNTSYFNDYLFPLQKWFSIVSSKKSAFLIISWIFLSCLLPKRFQDVVFWRHWECLLTISLSFSHADLLTLDDDANCQHECCELTCKMKKKRGLISRSKVLGSHFTSWVTSWSIKKTCCILCTRRYGQKTTNVLGQGRLKKLSSSAAITSF